MDSTLFPPIGDEDACLSWLWTALHAPDGASAVCRRCRTVRRFHRVKRRRAYACDHCGWQVYPTAGTFMQRSGLPLVTWFAAAVLIGSEGRIPPRSLAETLNVSYKTALRIMHKITQASAAGGLDASLLERLRRLAVVPAATRADAVAVGDRSSRAREHIRATACHVFATRGSSATRISDIAREAGVSSAIIHYYFKSKDEVLLAALQWANEHTSRRLQELHEETGDCISLLRRTLELAVPTEGVLRDEYLLWLEVWTRARVHPELLAECFTMSARWTDFIHDVIRQGETAGAFHPVAPAGELAQRLVALADGLAFRSAIGYSGMHEWRVREMLLGFAAEQLRIAPGELAGHWAPPATANPGGATLPE